MGRAKSVMAHPAHLVEARVSSEHARMHVASWTPSPAPGTVGAGAPSRVSTGVSSRATPGTAAVVLLVVLVMMVMLLGASLFSTASLSVLLLFAMFWPPVARMVVVVVMVEGTIFKARAKAIRVDRATLKARAKAVLKAKAVHVVWRAVRRRPSWGTVMKERLVVDCLRLFPLAFAREVIDVDVEVSTREHLVFK